MRAIILLAIALALPALCAEYHVAISGDNANPGTAEKPFRTIQRAADILQPGDVCTIHAGTYRETVRPANSGVEGAPIVFQAAAGEDVTISGADLVTGWTAHEKGIWKAALTGKPEAIYVAGEMMVPARWPNTGRDLLHPTLAKFDVLAPDKPRDPKKPDRDANVIAVEGLPGGPGAWNGALLWGICGNRWVSQTGTVVDSGGGKVTMGEKSGWWRMGKGAGFISGAYAGLDAACEWFWKDDTLFFLPPVLLEDATVEAKRRAVAIDLSGRNWVEVRELRVFSATISMDEATHCRVDRCRVTYPAGAITITGGFNRDRAVNSKSEGLGVIMSGEDNAITNSVVAYSAGDGISIWGKRNRVENCLVHDCNYSGTDCAPVCVTGDGHIIKGNTMYNGGRSIIVNRYLVEGKILNNHLYNAGLLTRDLGMVYTFQTDGRRKIKGPDGKDMYDPNGLGTEIAYNVIHDNYADGWGCVGIYLDNGCRHHILHHNVVWDVSEAMAHNEPNRNNLVFNNTLDGYRASIGCARPDPGVHDGSVFRNNLFTGATGIAKPGPGATVIVENNVRLDAGKLFINAVKHLYETRADKPGAQTGHQWKDVTAADYLLTPESPAIDAGVPVAPFTDGFLGKAPDCGAFELGAPMWSAGVDATKLPK